MSIFGVRAKIWDFLNVRAQKWVRPKCYWNAILQLFEYINLVKFSKNLQNFLKWRLRCRLGCFAPENPETLQSNPPPQGVLDPIISSAWTPKRARTGSYASLIIRVPGKMGKPVGSSKADSAWYKSVTISNGYIWICIDVNKNQHNLGIQ